MTDLSSLISRLESAKEGGRELDADIYEALHPFLSVDREKYIAWGSEQVSDGIDTYECADSFDIPAYTTSLGAALSLPPEWLHMRLTGRADSWACSLDDDNPKIATEYIGAGPTAPLALCIAILRSLDSGRGKE